MINFNFDKTLKVIPNTSQILDAAKVCFDALITDAKVHNIKNFLKEPSNYSLAMAVVTEDRYPEFTSPKAAYKMFMLVAEELDGGWFFHEFVCDLNGKNIQKIKSLDQAPIEPKNLGLSSQAEIIFYQPGKSFIVSNRASLLEMTTKSKRTIEKNVLEIYNKNTGIKMGHHVAIIS